MKNFLIFSVSIFSNFVYSVSPTTDSLFRNLNNTNVEDRTVVASYSIRKISQNTDQYFLNKFLYEINKSPYSKICQLNFAKGILNSSNIDEVLCFNRKSLLKNKTFKQKIFYSILDFALQNNSSFMIETLKSIGSQVKTNRELINKTKNFYLYQKKKYLESKKDGSQEVKNPLVSDNAQKNEKIANTLKESFLKKDPLVRRVKNGRDFYWKVEDQVFNATFGHKDHKLIKLEIFSDTGKYNILFKNYISVNGLFIHPERIEIIDPENNKYIISIKNLQLIEDDSNSFNKRISNYKKKMIKEAESITKVELIQ